jgi:hypothetical protein
MIYHAGVRNGYSTFCPSCYSDCGKRAVTGQTGSYTFASLDTELQFDLVVVRDGYVGANVRRVAPRGRAETIALTPRTAADDPNRVALGRVVDANGQPIDGAVVFSEGVETPVEGKSPVSTYIDVPGLEPVTVTNAKGEFELAYSQQATGILVWIEARGMARKAVAIPTGEKRKTISLSEGATILGRLIDHGKPAPASEVGLIPRKGGGFGPNLKIIGDPYGELRIGTQDDGSFVIPDVPAPVDWYIYGKMESVAARGATPHVECATKRDKEKVDVGDIQIQPGDTLRGTVALSDGAPMPDGLRVSINSNPGFEGQTVPIGRDGSFEFIGLVRGNYRIFTSAPGYVLPSGAVDKTIDRDTDTIAIVLIPEPKR